MKPILLRKRRLTVDGAEVVIRTSPNAMLLLREGEIIGQLRNGNGNSFFCIPSPQRGYQWEGFRHRDDAIRRLIHIHADRKSQ